MRIPSDEIPQADILLDVLLTAVCISQGGHSYQDIANFIGKVERQGRYYRKAAEIIGLITTKQTNYSTLTLLGQQLIQSGATLNNPVLFQAILNSRVFQRIIPFLELNSTNGVTRQDIIDFIKSVSEITAETMAPRRFSSVVSWLEELNIIQRQGERFYLANTVITENVPIINYNNANEPLLPRATNLQEYETVQMRTNNANETIAIYRNQAATDRADNSHRHLVNLVASRIRQSNSIPRYNQLIDLATRVNDADYIFEMKSITPSNTKSQIRNGLSQLYEYRYLQNLPQASLILVVETQLEANARWMTDYLQNDREVLLVWDGNNNLYGTEATREKLPFLGLIL